MMAYFWANKLPTQNIDKRRKKDFFISRIIYSGSKPNMKVNRDAAFNPV